MKIACFIRGLRHFLIVLYVKYMLNQCCGSLTLKEKSVFCRLIIPIMQTVKNLLLAGAAFFLFASTSAQDFTTNPFGKGLINITSQDTSWSAKVSTRIQTRYDGVYVMTDDTAFTGDQYMEKAVVRRARIKGHGFAFSPKIKYKFEYDLVNGQVLDAVVKWNFTGNWEVWFGQTKLPGNVERIISSQNLQFVDRSSLNSRFTLDRDAGLQLRHKFKIGDAFLVREAFAVSQGEGLNQTGWSAGNDYSGRVEVFPFGKFAGKGEYVGSDQKRESSPRIMLAGAYSYNVNALRSRGQKGDYISTAPRDIETIFADFVFKYKGLSMMVEYVQRRTTDGLPVVAGTWDPKGHVLSVDETYYTGSAINAQIGYLFNCNWEVAGRFTQITPQALTQIDNFNEYTLAVSRYIVGHNLKFQTDVSLIQEENSYDEVVIRFQTEFAF
ncbi:MAG: phosphate-selective porin OprO/OprP [Flavobacteriales bacterium]